MRIEPHRNLTVTLLRRNAFGPLRLRGASPRRVALLARAAAAASRCGCRPACHKPRRGEGWPWCDEPRPRVGPCAVDAARVPPPDRPEHRLLRTRPDWPIYGPPQKCWAGRLLDVIA